MSSTVTNPNIIQIPQREENQPYCNGQKKQAQHPVKNHCFEDGIIKVSVVWQTQRACLNPQVIHYLLQIAMICHIEKK